MKELYHNNNINILRNGNHVNLTYSQTSDVSIK